MRFKQALSRKLAAALSAVMILSTVAPTSVPVLAAAPDDVLVDSSVEYDLQDAGSEEVLLDSADSSIAEETGALEVAGEVVTNNDELLDVAEEAAVETGSEPAEEAVVEPAEGAGEAAVVKRTFTINVWDEGAGDGTNYLVAWKILSGNAKRDPANNWNDTPFTLSANKTYNFTDKFDGGTNVNNAANVKAMADGKINIEVSSNNAKYIRIYWLEKTTGGVEVVSANGARFDFSNTPNRYMDFDLDATSKVDVKAQTTLKGDIRLVWGTSPIDLANSYVSYDEIKPDGTKVNSKSRTAGYESGVYPYEILSGNKIQITSVTFNGSDKSYAFAEKYTYIGEDGKTYKDNTTTVAIQPNGLIAWDGGKYNFNLQFDRYLLATSFSSTLSTDCVFKPETKSGFPTLSIDKIANIPSSAYETGVVEDGAGRSAIGYFLKDVTATSGTIDLTAHYWDTDRSVYYVYKNVKFAGADCEVVNATEAEGDNVIKIKVPATAIINAFKGGSTIGNIAFDVDKKFSEVRIRPADITGSNGNVADILDSKGDSTLDKAYPNQDYVLTYGSTYTIIFSADNGYKLVSANISQKIVEEGKEKAQDPPINWWEPSDVAKLADGINFTVGLDPQIKITTGVNASHVVYYNDSKIDPVTSIPDAIKLKGSDNKYNGQYNKPIRIKLLQGNTQLDIVSFNAFNGSTPIYDTSIIGVDGTTGELKLNASKVSGNTINVKFADNGGPGDDIDKQPTVQSISIAIDEKDSKSVTLKNKTIVSKGDKFPLGATRVYEFVKKGDVDLDYKLDPADAGITATFVDDNKLVLSAGLTAKSDYKGKVKIVDANEQTNVLCEFGIELETSTVGMAKGFTVKKTGVTNNTIGLSFSLNKKISDYIATYKSGSSTVKKPISGLYYIVEATPSRTPSTTAIKTGYKSAFEVTGATQSEIIDLKVAGVAGTARMYEGDGDVEWTIKVTLVQTKATGTPESIASLWDQGAYKISAGAEATLNGVKTGKGQNFATKVTLKRGSKAKALYSNMRGNAYEIAVNYNSGCGVQLLNRVELLDKNGTILATANLGNVNAGELVPSVASVTDDGGLLVANNTTIYINPYNGIDLDGIDRDHLVKGSYTVKAYATEPEGHEVVGKMKVSVVEAVEEITAYPEVAQLWKKSGKAANTKLNVYDQNGKLTKKVKYTVIDGNQPAFDIDDPSSWSKKLAILSKVKISKSGAITVDKSYTPTGTAANNTFMVIVEANDYSGNPEKVQSELIRVRSDVNLGLKIENAKSKNVAALDQKNSPAGSIGSSYETSQFYYDQVKGEAAVANIDAMVSAKDFAKYRYFALLEVKNDNNADETVNFKYSIGGAKVLKFAPAYVAGHDVRGKVVIATNKPAKLSISGKALDGSNRTLPGKKKVVDIHYSTDAIWYKLYGYKTDLTGILDATDASYLVSSNAADSALQGKNYGTSDMALKLYVYGAKEADKDTADAMRQIINAKVTAKNATVKEITPGVWSILPKDKDVKITIKRGRNEVKEFTFTNPAVLKGKAIKVTASNTANGKEAKGKIYSYINFANGYGTAAKQMAPNKVTYTVDFSKLDVSGTDRVRIAVTKDYGDEIFRALGGAVNVAAFDKTLTSGKFTIDYNTNVTEGQADFYVKPGTYTLSVTPGKLDKGAFVATGKAVTVKVTAAKAPKASVKPATTIKLAKGVKTAGDIDFSKAKNYFNDGSGYNGITVNPAFEGVNTKGTINYFATAYELTGGAGKVYQLKFKGVAGKCDTINSKTKSELSGWISYTFRQLDGTTSPVQWVKVKVSPQGDVTMK